jgi:microcystin-dependent protein
MSQPYVGQISTFGFNFAPVGWALCQGQLLPINQYQALFALIGTTYGGNGVNTFALPDLRGRTVVNQGQGPSTSMYTIGEQTGVENVTVLLTQLPAHNHTVGVSNQPGTASDPTNQVFARVNTAQGKTPPVTTDMRFTTPAAGTMVNTAVSVVGGSLPHDNLGPLNVVNYCIALTGVFPSRG